jgi:hypothetical protein
LLETLRVLEAKHVDELQMAVSFIQSKVDKEEIIDEQLKIEITTFINKFIQLI